MGFSLKSAAKAIAAKAKSVGQATKKAVISAAKQASATFQHTTSVVTSTAKIVAGKAKSSAKSAAGAISAKTAPGGQAAKKSGVSAATKASAATFKKSGSPKKTSSRTATISANRDLGTARALSSAKVNSSKSFSEERPVLLPVQKCPLDQCLAQSLAIKCGHRGRSYELKLPMTGKDKEANPFNQLHVIAGETRNEDILHASLKMRKQLCPHHKQHPIRVTPEPKRKTNSGLSLEFDATCDRPSDWFSYIWLPAVRPKEYQISPNTCKRADGDLNGRILVFPDLNWDVRLSLSLGGFALEESYKKRRHEVTVTEEQWALQGAAELNYNGTAHQLEAEFRKYIETTLTFLRTAKQCCNTILPLVREMGGAELQIGGPSLELSLSGGFEELDDQYQVDTVFRLKLAASPLMSVKGTVDILDWLLKMGGPAGLTLSKIKNAAEKGIGKEGKLHASAAIAVELSVGGIISTEIVAEKKIGNPAPTVAGTLRGEIPFTLEGIANVEGDAFFLQFNAGFVCGGTFSVGAEFQASHDKTGVYLIGNFFFTGLVFYYAEYINAGNNKVKPPKKKHVTQEKYADGEVKYKADHRHEIIAPAKWPGEKGPKLYLIRNK